MTKSRGRPKKGLKFETPEKMEAIINAYFLKCAEKETIPTMSGIGVALDVARSTIQDYRERDGYDEVLRRAKGICERHLEERLLSGKNPIGAIFILKNGYGWKDKSTLEHDAATNLADIFKRAYTNKG